MVQHTTISPALGVQSPAGLEASKGAWWQHFNSKHSNKRSSEQVPAIRGLCSVSQFCQHGGR